jgi:hypothetical protein
MDIKTNNEYTDIFYSVFVLAIIMGIVIGIGTCCICLGGYKFYTKCCTKTDEIETTSNTSINGVPDIIVNDDNFDIVSLQGDIVHNNIN